MVVSFAVLGLWMIMILILFTSILEQLSAKVSPRTQEVDAGLSAKLKCLVSGHPVQEVLWYRDGSPLLPDQNR